MIYYISLGSNIGNRLQNLKQAKQWLAEHGTIQKQSSVFESAAWGNTRQAPFYNAVIRFQTEWRPFRLLRKLKAFETQAGRLRSEHWGPRLIDLDILLGEGMRISASILNIPHRYVEQRVFVLLPLSEIEPELILPSGQNVKSVLKRDFLNKHLTKIAENW